MRCPGCGHFSLKEKQYNGVCFDACEFCNGFWFDKGELNQIIEVAAEKLSIPNDAETSERVCPRCSVAMHTFKYPQTYCMIDMCSKCGGLWFDANELNEVKVVRTALKKKGKLGVVSEEPEEVSGAKGALLNFVNSAIDSLLH